VQEVRIKKEQSTAAFVNTDTSFTVTEYPPYRSLVSPGVSLAGTTLGDRLSLELYYNREFNLNYSEQIKVRF
jgi:hypothetical protein